MNHRKRTALILAPVLLAVLAGGVAWSQQGEGRRGDGPRMTRAERGEEREGWRGRHGRRGRHGHGEGIRRMARRLELTDEQVTAIKDVLRQARKKAIGLRAKARVARIELAELVSEPTVDRAKVDAKVEELSKIRGDRLQERTRTALAVRAVLTPEQVAKADGLLNRLLGGGKRHRGHR